MHKKQTFLYGGGIASFVEHLNRNKKVLHCPIISRRGAKASSSSGSSV